jgi:hypothetical protein
MRWKLLTDWAASSAAGGHIPAGEIIEGVKDKSGRLARLLWNRHYFDTALPLEALALDQAAADELARQHPDWLHRLSALPPAVIRPWPGFAMTAAEADYDHALAALDAAIAEHRAFGAALAAMGERWAAVAQAQAQGKASLNRRGM